MFIENAIHELDVAAENAKKELEALSQRTVFFQEKLEKIIVTRQALSAIEDINLNVAPPVVSLAPTETAPVKERKVREKKDTPKADKKGVPNTKAEFWLGLITEVPQKTSEILDAACTSLGVTDKEQRVILKQRQTSYLKNFVDDNKIRSEGEQQNRTYFL